MLRKKKLAALNRKREEQRMIADDALAKKQLAKNKREQQKRRKELKERQKIEFWRKYRENFKDCEVHEPRSTWAEGPTTKKRSVLENY